MASLTPLSKGLIGLAVLGGMASAAWHLYLKDRLGSTATQPAPAAVSTPMATDRPTAPATVTPTAPTTQAMPTTPTVAAPATQPVKAPNDGHLQASGRSAAENAEAGRKALAAGGQGHAAIRSQASRPAPAHTALTAVPQAISMIARLAGQLRSVARFVRS